MRTDHLVRVTRRVWPVNLLALLTLAGCAEPARTARSPFDPGRLPALRAEPAALTLPRASLPASLRLPLGGRLSERAELPPPPFAGTYVVDQLSRDVEGARFLEEGGEALTEALEAAEALGRPVAAYGPGALGTGELFGDDLQESLCDPPQLAYPTTHEGESWEITLAVAGYGTLLGGLEQQLGEMPEACVAALLAAEGDVEVAEDEGCDDLDLERFLPEGSDCRACVEGAAGDLLACQAAGACAEEAPVLEKEGGETWHVATGLVMACAPDYTTPALVLAKYDADGQPPDPFDLEGWGYLCTPFWSEEDEDIYYSCLSGMEYTEHGDTMRAGVEGMIEGMRREGDDTPWYRHRGFYTPRVVLEDGTEIRFSWETASGFAILSTPPSYYDANEDGVIDIADDYVGYAYGGVGIHPLQLRPDGVDPDALDDTFARDWYGAMMLKTATTRTGVFVEWANRNRCAEDGWDDLDGDGVWRCTEMGLPVQGWLNDGVHVWYNSNVDTTFPTPIATLASTGLPDEAIPGGIVPWVAGSPTLANPDWEDCAWSNSFVPDRVPLNDTPTDYSGTASLWGDSWRFGAHETDIRILLFTNEARHFCPDGIEP